MPDLAFADQLVSQSGEQLSAQKTLARSVTCLGVALHSGKKVSLTLKPAPIGSGIVFRRTDLPGSNDIPANWKNVVETIMCTTLGNADGVRVATVEHLMAALAGCHVDNAVVEVSGPEVPIMDGSSHPFVFLIECAGLEVQDAERSVLEILKPVKVEIGNRYAELTPSDDFQVAFEIDFDYAAVSTQKIAVNLVNGTFKKEIARARTFGFMDEVEKLQAAGLALGGSLDNAVVVDGETILNEGGLRYGDEFVRHKVLDAVGDLYLAGMPIHGSYHGVCAGHALTNQLLRTLFADATAWRISGDAHWPTSVIFKDEIGEESSIAATA
ncbi:MAG: UDP-3-O-acyl-N-acetylglucosamine deacetylase [Rhodospirillales bacterium]|nr:UDP-3-O-acyl-N-acetylglucosamine deacetylase [Rhodospirillales bacterium]